MRKTCWDSSKAQVNKRMVVNHLQTVEFGHHNISTHLELKSHTHSMIFSESEISQKIRTKQRDIRVSICFYLFLCFVGPRLDKLWWFPCQSWKRRNLQQPHFMRLLNSLHSPSIQRRQPAPVSSSFYIFLTMGFIICDTSLNLSLFLNFIIFLTITKPFHTSFMMFLV
jgi:hypothetical protein